MDTRPPLSSFQGPVPTDTRPPLSSYQTGGPAPAYQDYNSKTSAGGILSKYWDSLKSGMKEGYDSASSLASDMRTKDLSIGNIAQRGLGAAAQFGNAVVTPAWGAALQGAGKVASALTPDSIEQPLVGAVGAAGGKVMDMAHGLAQDMVTAGTPAHSAFVKMTEAMNKYQEMAKNDPEGAKAVEAMKPIAEYALNFWGLGAAKKAGSAAVEGATSAGKTLAEGAKPVLGGIADVAKGTGDVLGGVASDIGKGIGKTSETPTAQAVAGKLEGAVQSFQNAKESLAKDTADRAAVALRPPVERIAIQNHLPKNLVDRIVTATPETKAKIGEMFAGFEDRMTNVRSKFQPKEVAGQEIVDLADRIAKQRKIVGTAIGDTKSDWGMKWVDPNAPMGEGASLMDRLAQSIDNANAMVNDKGKIVAKPNYAVTPDELSVLQEVQNIIGDGKKLRASQLESLRAKSLAEDAIAASSARSGNAKGIAGEWYGLMKDAISGVDENYAKLASEYAQSSKVLNDFKQFMGFKGKLDEISSKGLKASENFSRIMGNAADRPQTILDDLSAEGERLGLRGKVNIEDLLSIADSMEMELGSSQTRNLAGAVDKGIMGAMKKIPGVGQLIGGAQELAAPSVEQKLRALKALLKEQAGGVEALAPEIPKAPPKISPSAVSEPSPKSVGKKKPLPKAEATTTGAVGGSDKPTTLYHGTQAKELVGEPRKTMGSMGEGFYLTDTPEKAMRFGKESKADGGLKRNPSAFDSATVHEFSTDGLKIKEFKDQLEYSDFVNKSIDPRGEKSREQILKELSSNIRVMGYDGMTVDGDTVIYNTGKLKKVEGSVDPLLQEAKGYKSADAFVEAWETPKTVKVWIKSRFSKDGAYADIPVIRKVDDITLYQGGSADGRQFWTSDKKYAESFGKVTEKTGSFYKVDNGNRVVDVYVEAPTKSQLTDIWKKANKK